MKILLLCCLATAMCFGVAAQTRQSEDVLLLRSTDVAYADAAKFAQFLSDHNFKVQSIHASKLNGFFRGVERAAYFKTDRGIVEVIFFPDATGAEKISVTEQRKDKRYIYSFEGQPQPNPPGDTFNSSQPMYFIIRGNLFIVIFDEQLSRALKSALVKK
ncbi:MAG: hypothetical protein M3209_15045 [Acidobacteriota bacterium]|nr:hypothetical protein [Acidobacteriota bacterium]